MNISRDLIPVELCSASRQARCSQDEHNGKEERADTPPTPFPFEFNIIRLRQLVDSIFSRLGLTVVLLQRVVYQYAT